MDMTDHEHGETMQGNSAAPLGCPMISVFPCSSQDGGNQVQGFTDLKVEFSGQSSHGSRDLDKLVLSESPGPPNKEPNRSLCNQELCKSPNICPEQIQQNPWGLLENHFYPIAHEYPRTIGERVQYVPFNMFSPGCPRGYQLQEFQYFVVIDFEATCDKEQIPQPQEIIEFPSVLVNSITGQLEASFQTYVRPAYHQVLTDFCKDLTGIQQIQVDRGVSLSEALLMHDRWLEQKGIKHTNFAVVTWSNWDCRVMLESECRLKRIRKPPYFNRWINLKIPFNEVFGVVRCNLKQAVQLAGLSWEGRAHCGLDDACNTARLLALLMCRGFRFSITNSLMWQSADCPIIWQPSTDRPSGTISSFQKQTQLPGHPPHFQPFFNKERHTYCFCGVMSSKCIVRKPGPKYGRFFFGCGNWTVTRGALCPYFEWAS